MKALFFVSRSISSGLGSGFSPIASGTVASAAACLAWWLVVAPLNSWILTLCTALGTFVVGILATRIVITNPQWLTAHASKGSRKGHLDPSEVVVDEWAGMLLTLTPMTLFSHSNQFLGISVGFVLFRVFDVFKPGPIGRAERLPGALGIMLDDMIAGGFAAALLALFLWAV